MFETDELQLISDMLVLLKEDYENFGKHPSDQSHNWVPRMAIITKAEMFLKEKRKNQTSVPTFFV